MRLFGIVATACLLVAMIALPLGWRDVFVLQDSISPIEWLILIGLLLEMVYILVTLIQRLVRSRQADSDVWNAVLLVLGTVCLLLFAGQKVMLDEIAREMRHGMETTGEWLILYVAFLVQLTYNVGTLLHSRSRLALPA